MVEAGSAVAVITGSNIDPEPFLAIVGGRDHA
jgi:hypothetical protein